MNRTFNIKEFFKLSRVYQKIARYLAFLTQKFRHVFPSIPNIAWKCGCSESQVHRFVRDLGGLFFTINRRKRPNGSDTSHYYIIDKDFLLAIIDLDRRNLLDAPRDTYSSIIQEFEKREEKMTPSPIPKWHPHIDSSFNEAQRKYIHPKIAGLGISQQSKEKLSTFSEAAIVKGLEDVAWYLKKGNRPWNPAGLLWERIKAQA